MAGWGKGSTWQLLGTIPLCPAAASERRAGRLRGVGTSAEAERPRRSLGPPLSRAGAGPRTHWEPGGLCRGEEGEQRAWEGAASSHDAASACTPALCCFPFCNYRNYRGLLQTAFAALLSFLSETLRFKKKINIGFGHMPKGNIMVYSLLFRKKR